MAALNFFRYGWWYFSTRNRYFYLVPWCSVALKLGEEAFKQLKLRIVFFKSILSFSPEAWWIVPLEIAMIHETLWPCVPGKCFPDGDSIDTYLNSCHLACQIDSFVAFTLHMSFVIRMMEKKSEIVRPHNLPHINCPMFIFFSPLWFALNIWNTVVNVITH